MDEDTLQRKAIAEIMREMDEAKQKELQLTSERKVNPLGKPNKHFLGRTISSMLTHNKREDDRKIRNCREKLKEMDDRAKRRMRNKYFNGNCDGRSRSKSRSDVVLRSRSSSLDHEGATSKRKTKSRKKKRKHKKRKIEASSSSSSSSSRSSSRSSVKNDRTKPKIISESPNTDSFLESLALENGDGKYYYDYDMELNDELVSSVNPALEYFAHVNQQYSSLAIATAACNQLNQFYQYSSMLATASQIRKPSVDDMSSDRGRLPDEKPIDDDSMHSKTLSSPSSIDEDENGIPTITVSTDNEASDIVATNKKRAKSFDSDLEWMLNSASEGEASVKSDDNACIDLNSDSKSSFDSGTDSSDVIFSCSSASEKELEGSEKPTNPGTHHNELMIDLTKE